MLTLERLEEWGRVKQVQVHMIRDRGIDIGTDEEYLDCTPLQIGVSLYCRAKKLKTSLAVVSSKQYKGIYVLFVNYNYDFATGSIKNTSLSQLKDALDTRTKGKVICILPSKTSTKGMQLVGKHEVILFSQLQFRVIDHALVPAHRRLSKKDATIYLSRRRLDPCHLPTMKVTDPVAVYYGYSPGDLVLIFRKGAGQSVFLRVVE